MILLRACALAGGDALNLVADGVGEIADSGRFSDLFDVVERTKMLMGEQRR